MKPTQTGIAVALALIVVLIFFMAPGLSPFGSLEAGPAIDTTTQEPTTTMIENVTELQITDTVVGTGEVAAQGDTVTVHYVGTFTDGRQFDASANHSPSGFSFPLGTNQIIQGWNQGVAGMRVGGKRRLVIPPALAYGEQGTPGGAIPPNATLVFDIELIGVQKAAQ
jgi:FKBP-type peptidyl-prolyl cis-trans isomerase